MNAKHLYGDLNSRYFSWYLNVYLKSHCGSQPNTTIYTSCISYNQLFQLLTEFHSIRPFSYLPTRVSCARVWHYFSTYHRYCHIDTQISIIGKQMRNVCVENQTVTVNDGRSDSFVDASRCGFPRKSSPNIPVEFKTIYEILGLFSRTDELNNRVELLMAFEFLLFFQN